MSNYTRSPEELYFWVGHPATGHSECGIRTEDKIGGFIATIEDKFGSITLMFTTEPSLPGVLGFITEQGYRIAVLERHNVDVTCQQESISEWVGGAW